MTDKLLPHNIDAEQAVLGSVLIDSDTMADVQFLHADDFYREQNGWIWGACQALYKAGTAINQITVVHELVRTNHFDAVDGAAYLSRCVASVPTSLHAGHFAMIVSNLATHRRLIAAAGHIAQIGYQADPDTQKSIERCELALRNVTVTGEDYNVLGGKELADIALEVIAQEKRSDLIPSGIPHVDDLIGGYAAGDLIIIGARPQVGKTHLAVTAANAQARASLHVLIFSKEEGNKSFVRRLLSVLAKVSQTKLRLKSFNEYEEQRLADAVGFLSQSNLYLPKMRSGLTTDKIRTIARRQADRDKLDIIYVDYLQLLEDKGERVQRVTNISHNLKSIAMELGIPLVAVSALSRASEYRPDEDKMPRLSDLRESGDIESDADFAFMLDRPWTRKPNRENEDADRLVVEVELAKNRPTGQLGRFTLRFQPLEGKFEYVKEGK